MKYKLTISFNVDREMTEEEIENLKLQIAAQIEEPVNEFGEEVEYATDLLEIEVG